MPVSARSLLDIAHLTDTDLNSILHRAKQFKEKGFETPRESGKPQVMASCFLEPSTRTRVSFEIAAARLGFRYVSLGDASATSLVKGESEVDTFYTVKSMQPDLIIIRFKENQELRQVLDASDLPIISAGEGRLHHPTQALLDALTIQQGFDVLEGLNILFAGDTLHSRVAHSGAVLFRRLGAKVAFASPEHLLAKNLQPDEVFADLASGAKWADVVIGLRTQTERHSSAQASSRELFEFRLDAKNLSGLKAKALIMHPGPFVPMVDFDPALLQDKRCRVHQQVENGVYIRAAVIQQYARKVQ